MNGSISMPCAPPVHCDNTVFPRAFRLAGRNGVRASSARLLLRSRHCNCDRRGNRGRQSRQSLALLSGPIMVMQAK